MVRVGHRRGGGRRPRVCWLLALAALGYAMTVPTVPAQALEEGLTPEDICAGERGAIEVTTEQMPLSPADGATVVVGTPVTFSGEPRAVQVAGYAPVFKVASSPASLSSPDIDSGPGSLQPGTTSSYAFTSTEATATPRTIYWAASLTLTPRDCTDPSTFTTPTRTLTVVTPPTAEQGGAKQKQEEEAAAKQKQDDEAAAKKKQEEEATAGGASVRGTSLTASSDGIVGVKVSCPAGESSCSGTLTLRSLNAVSAAAVHQSKKRTASIVAVAAGSFKVAGGDATTVKLHLSAKARTLLARAHVLRVRATIVAHDPAGATHTTQAIVTIHAAKASHSHKS
jgi:hypothetical protein